MEICSHYGHHAQTVTEGKWENNADWCYWDYPMIELYGKTAGIIGLGRIGQATAKILNSMDMKVIAYDAYESEAGKKLAEYVDLDTLFSQSDVIFLHCPLFPETEGIINCEYPPGLKQYRQMIRSAWYKSCKILQVKEDRTDESDQTM